MQLLSPKSGRSPLRIPGRCKRREDSTSGRSCEVRRTSRRTAEKAAKILGIVEGAPSAPSLVVTTGIVRLDGTGSVAGLEAILKYRWTQVDGPPVKLSDPLSPVTTFATVDSAARQSHAFQLFVDGGVKSEPQAVQLDVVPGATVTLAPGLNLVAYPIGPPLGSTAQTLAATSGASFVARIAPGPTGRMRHGPYLPGLTGDPFALDGNRAYLIVAPQGRMIDLGP